MPSIKIHFAIVRSNQWGGHNYYTGCGRSSARYDSADGINDTTDWSKVTCKLCLQKRTIIEKREQRNGKK